jgi:hypothetical protein
MRPKGYWRRPAPQEGMGESQEERLNYIVI